MLIKPIAVVKRYGKAIFVVVLFECAFGLISRLPLWLAPPYMMYTGLIYLGLLAVAFLLLVYQFYRMSIEGHWIVYTGIACLILSCCWLVTIAGSIPLPDPFGSFSCEEESLGDGRIRYTCTRQSIEERTVYTLEGREGWVIVWLVDQEFHP